MRQSGNDGLPDEVACPECEGKGTVEWETQDRHRAQTECSNCMGTGKVIA